MFAELPAAECLSRPKFGRSSEPRSLRFFGKRHVDEPGGFQFSDFAAAIVLGGGRDARMAGHLLHHGDVGAGSEQVAYKGPPFMPTSA